MLSSEIARLKRQIESQTGDKTGEFPESSLQNNAAKRLKNIIGHSNVVKEDLFLVFHLLCYIAFCECKSHKVQSSCQRE